MAAKSLPSYAKDYLAKRGIDAKAAKKRKLTMLAAKETKAEFGVAVPALEIPYYRPSGAVLKNRTTPFARVRLFPEQAHGFAKHSGGTKFKQRAGTGNHIYYDPAVRSWLKILKDTTCPLVITEGEVKAICATEHDLICIAFGGVWSWRTKINGKSAPLPGLNDVAWRGRQVEIAFDSDTATNTNVQAALFAIGTELKRRGANVAQVIIPNTEDGDKQGLDDFLVANGRSAFDDLPRGPVRLVLSPGSPLLSAQAFVLTNYTHEKRKVLVHHNGAFYSWCGTHYPELSEQTLRSKLYAFLNEACQWINKGDSREFAPFHPTTTKVNNLVDALAAECHLDAGYTAPCFIYDANLPAADELIPCVNGLLHLKTRKLYPHSPSFFTLNALDFEYDPDAAKPKEWLKFLNSLWSEDPEAIQTLREIFGLLLTQVTRHQKIFMIIGPRRSGKGTIARVLTELLGKENVASPTLASLSQNFGLAPLVTKQLAIISDARLSKSTNRSIVTERLLSISGEDSQLVDRKYRDPWNGKFTTRFLILTNELPQFMDTSGALPSRFIMLMLRNSFLGREDLALTDKLLKELPGLLNWSIDGWKRLDKRNYFKQPKSSDDALRELDDLASPVGAFVRDWCEIGKAKEVGVDELFEAHKRWRDQHDYTWKITKEKFGSDKVIPMMSMSTMV